MKVVINSCHGGFGLSDEGIELYLRKAGLEYRKEKGQYFSLVGYDYYVNDEFWSDREISRSDPLLVEVVEELGEKANGRFAELTIVNIPDDVEWHISEYDGFEHIAENHRTWP